MVAVPLETAFIFPLLLTVATAGLLLDHFAFLEVPLSFMVLDCPTLTEWGLYVEVNENKCEGMIPMHELDDDFYDFDEKAFCLTGRRFRKKYSLGDPIRIKVVRANLERKQLDFALVE